MSDDELLAELFESHVAEGMSDQAAAELVDGQWPTRFNIHDEIPGDYDYEMTEEWIKPHAAREIARLKQEVMLLRREIAAMKQRGEG